jgi:hypothetical protein
MGDKPQGPCVSHHVLHGTLPPAAQITRLPTPLLSHPQLPTTSPAPHNISSSQLHATPLTSSRALSSALSATLQASIASTTVFAGMGAPAAATAAACAAAAAAVPAPPLLPGPALPPSAPQSSLSSLSSSSGVMPRLRSTSCCSTAVQQYGVTAVQLVEQYSGYSSTVSTALQKNNGYSKKQCRQTQGSHCCKGDKLFTLLPHSSPAAPAPAAPAAASTPPAP